MKKALAVILAVLAHLSPIAASAAMNAARAYSSRTYQVFPQIYAVIAASALFGLLYCGALLLMLSAKMPLAVSVIGFFLSFFYVAFFFFGYFYTPIRIFTLGEPFVMVCMFIPFWLVLLVRSVWAHKKALLEPDRPE